MDIQELINQIIYNFDWAYMLSVNVLTYIIIKFIEGINTKQPVKGTIKRIILIVCTLVLAFVYKQIDADITNKVLLNSAILAPVAWDFIFRPILIKFRIGYRQKDFDKFKDF